jgi:hypothetical protein
MSVIKITIRQLLLNCYNSKPNLTGRSMARFRMPAGACSHRAGRRCCSASARHGWARRAKPSFRALLIEAPVHDRQRHQRFGQSAEPGGQLELELPRGGCFGDRGNRADSGCARKGRGARLRATQTSASSLPAHLPREAHLSGTFDLPMLRRGFAQDRRGPDRDAGTHPAAVEGGPARAREVLLPLLREHHPAAGALAPDRARAGRASSCSPMSCSRSTACTCRSTARVQHTPAKASISMCRRLPTGSVPARQR